MNKIFPENLNILITGGAGFIGSNAVEALLDNNELTVMDNLRNVDDRFIKQFMGRKNFHFKKLDITRMSDFSGLKTFDLILHLAANSDVRGGSGDPETDFNINALGTFNVLEFMRKTDTKRIMFASSSTVYGEASVLPTPENYGPYMPISSYGASKMAGEGFISAYSHYYGITGAIFRFANIVGKNSTHGVIFDFINKLRKNSRELEILGDGSQRKSYLHVNDCIGSMFHVNSILKKTDVFNLGNHETTSVLKIADFVIREMGLENVEKKLTGGPEGRGWKGDVKLAQLSIDKISATGWKNKYSSDQSVEIAVKEALAQIGPN